MSPKSRFSLKRALFVCSILVVLIFEGCADKIKTDLNAFKVLDESLMNSNALIHDNSSTVFSDLENRMADPRSVEKAKIWYPKAQMIGDLSNQMFSYIEGLKSELKKEAGLKMTEKGDSTFKEADKNAVMHVFIKNEKGVELYQRLKQYKQDVLNTDSQISSSFKNVLTTSADFGTSVSNAQDFEKNFFDDVPVVAALAVLTKFQSNVKIDENKLIDFCHNQTASGVIGGHRFNVGFAAINNSYVKAGQRLEITAGIRSFSKWPEPTILINNKKIPIEVDGVALYKFTASDKAGKHFIPVEISFIDEDGNKKTYTKNIEYTVGDCP